MVPDSEVPFLADVIEARQHDELVVEHVFEAVTDDEVSDIEEYSTGDDTDSDVENAAGPEVPGAEVPDDEVPDAEVPDAEVPDAEVPDDAVPDAEGPEPAVVPGVDGDADEIAHAAADDAADDASDDPTAATKNERFVQAKKNYHRGIYGHFSRTKITMCFG